MDCHYSWIEEIFTKDDLKLIDDNKSEMCYSEGDIILKQRSYVSQVVYLKSGLLKIVLEGKNNRNTILGLVGSKDFIALPVLGSLKMYPYSVIAITKCDICFIRTETIIEILKNNIKANQFLLKWYSEDYLYLYSKISTISTRNNHGKLASVLLYLTNGSFNDDVLNLISRKELAELASISTDSSNKILTELKNDKIIDINKKGITILNRGLIEKLSTVG